MTPESLFASRFNENEGKLELYEKSEMSPPNLLNERSRLLQLCPCCTHEGIDPMRRLCESIKSCRLGEMSYDEDKIVPSRLLLLR